jgi:hypothetical protein
VNLLVTAAMPSDASSLRGVLQADPEARARVLADLETNGWVSLLDMVAIAVVDLSPLGLDASAALQGGASVSLYRDVDSLDGGDDSDDIYDLDDQLAALVLFADEPAVVAATLDALWRSARAYEGEVEVMFDLGDRDVVGIDPYSLVKREAWPAELTVEFTEDGLDGLDDAS